MIRARWGSRGNYGVPSETLNFQSFWRVEPGKQSRFTEAIYHLAGRETKSQLGVGKAATVDTLCEELPSIYTIWSWTYSIYSCSKHTQSTNLTPHDFIVSTTVGTIFTCHSATIITL